MAMSEAIDGGLQHAVLSSVQGHAFMMEASRQNHLSGVMSIREGITHRTIAESGGGQARAQLPGGMGGVPTVAPK